MHTVYAVPLSKNKPSILSKKCKINQRVWKNTVFVEIFPAKNIKNTTKKGWYQGLQGFVLNIKKVKSEDLLVTVLTEKRIKKLYRFYGVRHSAINLGFKIDFVAESVVNKNILRLRELMHLGFSWLHDNSKLQVWQNFLSILNLHLHDATEIDPFYYELLCEYADIFGQSNSKRLAVEAFAKILRFEGMANRYHYCFVCDKSTGASVSIGKGLLVAHPECVRGRVFSKKLVTELLENCRSIYFENDEVDSIYEIIQKGF